MMIFSFILILVAWWALSHRFRHMLYAEWTMKPTTTFEYIKQSFPSILRQLSPQQSQALGFVDGELKILNQRQSFMMICFQRIAVVFPGLILLGVLQIPIFIGLILVATILLMVFFKNPIRWVQIALITAVFFMLYQWSYYQASQWIYTSNPSEFVYTLVDSRLLTILGSFAASALLTLIFRFEFWSLWISSILFFAGGIALLNAMGLVVGEVFGWTLFWCGQAFFSSKKNRKIQLEVSALTVLTIVSYFFILLFLKTMGSLDVRLFGSIADKKLVYLLAWGGWEIWVTVVLSIWGHFRSQSEISEVTDLEKIKLSPSVLGRGLFGYKSWLPEQLEFRKKEIERKLSSIQNSSRELENHVSAIPSHLKEKSRLEVESLQGLLGALTNN
jgi:hypothetical protein